MALREELEFDLQAGQSILQRLPSEQPRRVMLVSPPPQLPPDVPDKPMWGPAYARGQNLHWNTGYGEVRHGGIKDSGLPMAHLSPEFAEQCRQARARILVTTQTKDTGRMADRLAAMEQRLAELEGKR